MERTMYLKNTPDLQVHYLFEAFILCKMLIFNVNRNKVDQTKCLFADCLSKYRSLHVTQTIVTLILNNRAVMWHHMPKTYYPSKFKLTFSLWVISFIMLRTFSFSFFLAIFNTYVFAHISGTTAAIGLVCVTCKNGFWRASSSRFTRIVLVIRETKSVFHDVIYYESQKSNY